MISININPVEIKDNDTNTSYISLGQCLRQKGRKYPYDNVPEFTEPLKNITVQMGRNATFTCHINGILDTGYRVSICLFLKIKIYHFSDLFELLG